MSITFPGGDPNFFIHDPALLSICCQRLLLVTSSTRRVLAELLLYRLPLRAQCFSRNLHVLSYLCRHAAKCSNIYGSPKRGCRRIRHLLPWKLLWTPPKKSIGWEFLAIKRRPAFIKPIFFSVSPTQVELSRFTQCYLFFLWFSKKKARELILEVETITDCSNVPFAKKRPRTADLVSTTPQSVECREAYRKTILRELVPHFQKYR